MAQKLAGKVALVTGAPAMSIASARRRGGIGIVNYSSARKGLTACRDQRQRRQGRRHSGQPAKEADIRRLFAETKKVFGKLDVLVNNAGIYEFAPLENVTAEHFHKQFDLNVLGLILASQEAAKHFGPNGGSIINISSIAATMAPATGSVYSATKAAVNAVTISLAKELGPRKIRVNAIGPGMVETDGLHSAGIADSDFRKQTESQTPLGRIGQPSDIAPAVVFLASADASWITGETLYISGGNR
jgi:3-oxoacyl-[acyl-carrier protein] reductase